MGGGKGPSVETPPEADPIPSFDEVKEPVKASVRDAAARRLRVARGHAGNIVTSPFGAAGIPALGLGAIFDNTKPTST